MKPSKTEAAQAQIVSYFEASEKKAYTDRDLGQVLSENRQTWKLKTISVVKFLQQLQELQIIKPIELHCPLYGHKHIRYVFGSEIPIYQLGHTIKNRAYYSHQSALYLQGLTNKQSETIYINAEQSEKPQGKSSLVQSNIDRAFQNQGRKSNYIFECENWQIHVLNGKNTRNLGVEMVLTPHGSLPVTNLERTLIDIVVRPGYTGGCQEVLEAYRNAKDKISAYRLAEMLKQINYAYPYHQAIGFYTERAGYDQTALTDLKKLGVNYDFYLDYGMKEKNFSKEWRIYYPNKLN